MKPRNCTFCKGSGLSKEHFWPDWLRAYMNTSASDMHITELHRSEGKVPATVDRRSERPGNVITKKFRVVCANCNNGWMSRLEESIKPFLVSVLEGKRHTLDENGIAELARWIVMKVMVSEYAEDGTQLTPYPDRNRFRESQEIPSYFRIYMGKHNIVDQSAYLRCSATLSSNWSGPAVNIEMSQRNTQTVCFLLGPVVFFVVACREENLKVWKFFKLNQLKCIFPFKKKQFNWHTLHLISQPQIANIANALNDLTQSPMVKYGGPLPN